MRRPSSQEPPDEDTDADADADEVYLPFAGRSRSARAGEGGSFDDCDDQLEGESLPQAVRLRPPSKGLSGRDRREWQRLEVARFNRETRALVDRRHSTAAGWSAGFINNPPRGLGRKGRRAWHAAEQEATQQWWAQRRASNRDIDARAVGALIIAALIGVAVIVGLITHRGSSAAAVGGGSSTAIPSRPGPRSAAGAAQPATPPPSSSPAPVVPGATGPVAVASKNPAIGVTPTVTAPLAGQWQPTPVGGVPAKTPKAAPPVSPAAVKVQPAPAGAVTAADQAGPQAVVTAWLARTCPSSWRERFGADLTRGKDLETAAAWRADDPAHDTVGAALWRSEVVAHRQTRRCGNRRVVVSPDQPVTAGGAFVLYSADRVVTSAAGGLPVTVEQLSGGRRVVKQAGVWRVDIAVVGG